ncbi:uncharacterized protein [Leuresthes tenuis]|uniref:uncharacterized protein n=1 Tax=Leuresthes tenuis TaxID=355514 RepID=UPI003B502391
MAPGRNKNLPYTPNPPSSETQAYHVPQLPHGRIQWIRLNKPSQNSMRKGTGISGQRKEYPTFEALGRIPDVLAGEKFESLTHMSEILNGLDQNEIVKQNPDLQTLPLDPFLSISDLSQPHETKPAFSLYRSSADEMEIERPVYQPESWPEPPKSPELHPYLEPQEHVGNDLLLSGNYKTHVPGNLKSIASKNIPDSLELQQWSMSNELTTATSKAVENLEMPAAESGNAQFGVQNIRVKPPSKFVSAGPHLIQKPVVQQANPSQHATGLTAIRSDRNHWTPIQTPEPRGSTTREKKVPQRPEVLTLVQERGFYGGHINPDQSAMTNITNLSPDRAGRQQKPAPGSPDRAGRQQKPAPGSPDRAGRQQKPAPGSPDRAGRQQKPAPGSPDRAGRQQKPAPGSPDRAGRQQKPAPRSPDRAGRQQKPAPRSPDRAGRQQKPAPRSPDRAGRQQKPAPRSPDRAGRQQKPAPRSPDRAGRQQKPVQPLQETESKGWGTLAFQRDVLHTAGTSHLGVGPAPLSVRLQNQSTLLQNPDSVTFQNSVPHVKFSTSNIKVQNLMSGSSEFTYPQTDPDGSDDLVLRSQSRSGCAGDSSRYGASVHQGIIRG